MRPWKLIALAALALGFAVWRIVLPRVWSHPAASPIDLSIEPAQEPLLPPISVAVTRGGRPFQIEKLHSYEISGLVLSATSYDLTWRNDFFDVDVGLIWGPRREELQRRYSFFQMGRWLFWRSEGPVSPADRDEVTRHISNNHLIPSDRVPHLGSAIRAIRTGDRIRIRGALVRILDDSGQVLATSSATRDDIGDGACEIIWVDELQVGSRVFR